MQPETENGKRKESLSKRCLLLQAVKTQGEAFPPTASGEQVRELLESIYHNKEFWNSI